MLHQQGMSSISVTQVIRFQCPVFNLVKNLSRMMKVFYIYKGRSLCNEELSSIRLFLGNTLRGYTADISHSRKGV